MALSVVTAATLPIMTVDDAKDFLRIDHPDEDAKIEAYISAVASRLEAATQRRFMTQTLDWTVQGWSSVLVIPVAPVASVTSVKYRDRLGVQQTLSTDQYVVYRDAEATKIRPIVGAAWPYLDDDASDPVVVRFVAGAATASEAVKQAATVYLHMLYDNPTLADVPMAPSGLPVTVENLIASERW